MSDPCLDAGAAGEWGSAMYGSCRATVGDRLRAVAGFSAVAVVVGAAATAAAVAFAAVGAAGEPAGAAVARFSPPAARPAGLWPGGAAVPVPGPVSGGALSVVAGAAVPGVGLSAAAAGTQSGLESEAALSGLLEAVVRDAAPPGPLDVVGSEPVIDAPAAAAGAAGRSAGAAAGAAVFQQPALPGCVQADASISTKGVRQARHGLPPAGHLMRKVRVNGKGYGDDDFVGGNFDFADFSELNPDNKLVMFWFWTPH